MCVEQSAIAMATTTTTTTSDSTTVVSSSATTINKERFTDKTLEEEDMRNACSPPPKPRGSVPDHSASPNLTKRKKDMENSRDGSCSMFKRLKYDWNQTDEHVTITLQLEDESDIVKFSDPEFSRTGVWMKFPDGKVWSLTFNSEIDSKDCKTELANSNSMVLTVKKKVHSHWASLEATINEECTKSPAYMDNTMMENRPQEMVQELNESNEKINDGSWKENDSLYQLQHTKHDWIEKNDTFTIHIYVKKTNKDVVRVFYEEKLVTVLFQTSDQKYLDLHPGSTEQTMFSWKINVKNEIIPQQCKHRVTGALIEITLLKKEVLKWGALEVPLQKKSSSATQRSSDWQYTTKEKPAITLPNVEMGSCSVGSNAMSNTPCMTNSSSNGVAFDEMQNLNTTPVSDNHTAGGDAFTLASSCNKQNSLITSQKPTCKVSPMNKLKDTDQVVSPGFTGLDNLGNTCFMNSVLQCLANTREFRDYFLDNTFQKEINTENLLGSGGLLASAFAVLLRMLWNGKHTSHAPSKLKNLVAMKASQFTGFAQHDAQEFMAFLLDILHEDLNRVKNKPYTQTVDSDGRRDEVVANEAWEVYKKRNDSFIVDLFQGQYKSKLVCPICEKLSITFDPFCYLSIPLPKKLRLIPVVFFWREPYRKPIQYKLRLPKDATVELLKEKLSKKTLVKPRDIRVFEPKKGRIHKIYGRGSQLSNDYSTEKIFACEVLSQEIAGEPVFEIYVIQRIRMPISPKCSSCGKKPLEGCQLKRCANCYTVGYCNQECQKAHWEVHKDNCKCTPVGSPFLISLPKSRATFSRLRKLMEAYSRYSVDVFQPPVKVEPSNISKSTTSIATRSSTSNLSSSSQSSGSLSSLDSQASYSSACTLTADNEQNLADDEEEEEQEAGHNIQDGNLQPCMTPPATSISKHPPNTNPIPISPSMPALTPHTDQVSLLPLFEQTKDDKMNDVERWQKDSSQLCDGTDSGTFVTPSTTIISSVSPSLIGGAGDSTQPAILSATNCTPADRPDRLNVNRNHLPTGAVLGLQNDDTEHGPPLFSIKQVTQDGNKIVSGESFEDRGDELLDLRSKTFLAMDWKNNDRVLTVWVQSRELECEDDESMRTESLDENGEISLDQCLNMFTEPEVLSPDEAWYCPQCKEHREATKQLSIWRLPHTLIIQLKRFSFGNISWRDKVDKMVNFPTRGLDMSHYFVGNRPDNKTSTIYDLYGVINHTGGILGGHYTAYVRCADKYNYNKNEVDWRFCDDSRVIPFSEKNVVTRLAYLLFYRRRDKPPQIDPKAGNLLSCIATSTSAGISSTLTSSVSPVCTQDKSMMENLCCKKDELPELDTIPTQETKLYSTASGWSNSSDEDFPPTLDNRYTCTNLNYTDMDAVD